MRARTINGKGIGRLVSHPGVTIARLCMRYAERACRFPRADRRGVLDTAGYRISPGGLALLNVQRPSGFGAFCGACGEGGTDSTHERDHFAICHAVALHNEADKRVSQKLPQRRHSMFVAHRMVLVV